MQIIRLRQEFLKRKLSTFKKNYVDFIIMSKRQKISGFRNLLNLGSVSRKILERAKCSILITEP